MYKASSRWLAEARSTRYLAFTARPRTTTVAFRVRSPWRDHSPHLDDRAARS